MSKGIIDTDWPLNVTMTMSYLYYRNGLALKYKMTMSKGIIDTDWSLNVTMTMPYYIIDMG